MKGLLTRVLGVFLIGIGTFIFSSDRALAATFTRTEQTAITVTDKKEANVLQTHTVSWDDSSQYFPASQNYIYVYITPALVSQKEDILQKVSNIVVKNQHGTTLSFSQTVEDGSIRLKVPYYKDLKRYQDLVFKVSYTTSLYTFEEGGVLEVYYPGLPADAVFTQRNQTGGYTDQYAYSVSVIIPESVGPVASAYPVAGHKTKKNGKTTVEYSGLQLKGNAVRIVAGTERKISFTLEGKTYATNTQSPDFVKDILFNYIEVALPTSRQGTEFANQTVYYTKIEPFPVSITTDGNGNVIARLPISATKDEIIRIEGYAIVKPLELPSTITEIPMGTITEDLKPYILEEPQYWQVNSDAIRTLGEETKDTKGLQLQSVRNALVKVVKTLSYPESVSEEDLTRQGALGALSSKVGVCMEYSDLLLSILRAQSIPTRTVYGDGLGRRVDKTLEGIGHQWVGVWFQGIGWVPVEPTWSDENDLQVGYDMDHFTWYVASKSVNEPLGFSCNTIDSTFPCKESLKIYTESVDSLPPLDTLKTIDQIQTEVEKSTIALSPVRQVLQNMVTYLGTSRFGRVLLSTQGLLLLLALFTYILLVMIIATITKIVKARKKTTMGTESAPSK